MTLCIAAICESEPSVGDAKRAVLAFDLRAETTTAGAENEWKFERLAPSWCALIAGTISHARELASAYRVHLTMGQAITSDNALEQLRIPINKMRRSRADQLTQARLAISYDQFLTDGPGELPEDIRRQLFFAIEQQELEVELLILGWIDDGFRLFKYSGGELCSCSSFGAIGTGTAIAEATLYQRVHHKNWSLSKTVYAVFEAQLLGRIAPGVGSQYYLAVMRRDPNGVYGGLAKLSAYTYLNAEVSKYGPKPIDAIEFTLPSDAFGEASVEQSPAPETKT